MRNRDLYARMRYIFQNAPALLHGVGVMLARTLARRTVRQSETVVVGDHFFGTRTDDLDMLQAAPDALALAVGGSADPRAERVFVWPTKGHAATQEILGALGR